MDRNAQADAHAKAGVIPGSRPQHKGINGRKWCPCRVTAPALSTHTTSGMSRGERYMDNDEDEARDYAEAAAAAELDPNAA